MGEFEAHVRCVFPWLWVTDFEVFWVFFYFNFLKILRNVCTWLPVGGAQCKPNSQ